MTQMFFREAAIGTQRVPTCPCVSVAFIEILVYPPSRESLAPRLLFFFLLGEITAAFSSVERERERVVTKRNDQLRDLSLDK